MMDRRDFLKLTIGSAAVVWANRAIGQAPHFIRRDEVGLWMRWIQPDGSEPSSPKYERAKVYGYQGLLCGSFGCGFQANAQRFEIWRDGVKMLWVDYSPDSLKHSSETWLAEIDIHNESTTLTKSGRSLITRKLWGD